MRKVNKVVWGLFLVLSVLLTAPVTGWARVFAYTRPHYYFLPLQMQFADRGSGNPIGSSSNMILYGGQTREFAVDVVDFNKNGIIDIRDFKVYEINHAISLDINILGDIVSSDSPQVVSLDVPIPADLGNDAARLIALRPDLRKIFEAAFRDSLDRRVGHSYVPSSTKDLLDVTFDADNLDFYESSTDPRITPPVPLPGRVLLCRVTARQQLGDSKSGFGEQLAQLKYTIYWGPRSILNDDKEREKLVTKAETPEMNILIRPTDQGGQGGDNGGGSCDMLAWGAALLPLPGLFFLRRRRK